MHIIPLSWVMILTKLSRSTIYRKISKGTFPKSVPIPDTTPRYVKNQRIGWIEKEIDSWRDRNTKNDRLMNMEKIRALTGLSRDIIYKSIKKGTFPKAIPSELENDSTLRWVDDEIYQWLRNSVNRIDKLCSQKSVNQRNDDENEIS